MGEYIRLDDKHDIKIGTCEDLYYLRADQLIRWISQGRVSAKETEPYLTNGSRFRFPFPDEDGIEILGSDAGFDYNRGLTFTIPRQDLIPETPRHEDPISHNEICRSFSPIGDHGHNVNVFIPCPLRRLPAQFRSSPRNGSLSRHL